MSKITQKSRLKAEDSRQQSEQLIEQIKELKEIKPRQEWVVLAKSQIFAEEQKFAKIPAQKISIPGIISNWNRLFHSCNSAELSKFQISNSFSRRLAYSFATMLFIFVGLIGFAQYTMPGDLLFPIRKIAEQSEATLMGQTALKQNVATLNNRINDLAKAAKEGKKDNIPSAISEINTNASELAKDLKNNSVTDAETLKEIAVSLKTLANVPGTDLNASAEVKDLYQAVVEGQIADLEETTLTENQEEILIEIKDLYEQGKYIDALEEILTINN